jgi:hypothetical protein
MKDTDTRVTTAQLLYPLSVMAVALFLFFAFQMAQVLRDHDGLIAARAQQEKGVEDSQKIQAQLVALVVGTQKLAGEGNENAKKIVDRLKAVGVIPQKQPQQGGAMTAEPVAPAPVPAMQETGDKDQPVKP